MNDRIKKLRQQSLDAKPSISAERAELMTEFFEKPESRGLSAPMPHALAFKHIMENKAVTFNDGELIVGERGPAPKATPTYPEVCCHSLQDLRFLNDRKKTAFAVGRGDAGALRREDHPLLAGPLACANASSPPWRPSGSTPTRRASSPSSWSSARPGTRSSTARSTRKGSSTSRRTSRPPSPALDFMNDPEAYDKREELEAMAVSCGRRSSPSPGGTRTRRGSSRRAEKDPARRKELERIAEVCERVPARRAPRFLGGPPGLLVRPPRRHHRATTPGTRSTRAGSTSTSARSTRKGSRTGR